MVAPFHFVLFTGPTLPAAEVQEAFGPECHLRPPAACGDVYRACRDAPRAIALVDGYFDQQLSVWHKEILWALSQGIHVYGAASMGALRAAELAALGMVGVGRVFEQLSEGVLEDDDEVAVLHESEERGFGVRSLAMVNLRATLGRATEHEALDRDAAERLIQALKGLFYLQRSERALRQLARELLPAPQATNLERHLDAHGVVDQKREDARALLRRVAADRAAGVLDARHAATFRFAYTDAWHSLRVRIDAEKATAPGERSPS